MGRDWPARLANMPVDNEGGHDRGVDSMKYYRAQGLGVVELAPARCSSGHPLGADQVLVGSLPCLCAGLVHRTWTCVRCTEVLVWPACEQRPGWTPWQGDG